MTPVKPKARPAPKPKAAAKPEGTSPTPHIITNCVFTGVQWDATAVKAVQTVAEGLVQNAKGLKTLAKLFEGQSITMEALLKITP